MATKVRSQMLALISIAVVVALALMLSSPQVAFAKASPWGSGTTYNAKTETLTIKSGKHAIKSLSKIYKGRYVNVEKLVVRGGTTKLNTQYSYLSHLKVLGGKLTSTTGISVSGNMVIKGGAVSIATKKRGTTPLHVSEDLLMSGGRIACKSTKEGCEAIRVFGDMRVKKGAVTAQTKGKNANGIQVSGYLKVYGGKVASATAGKSSVALQVFGDLVMSKGSISASSKRGAAIDCFDLLKITGGKISASSAKGEMAMSSGEEAVVKPNCLKTIKGLMPEGAKFTKGGVTYRVTNRYTPAVKVVKGKAKTKTIKFGGISYAIESSLTAGSLA